MGMLGAGTHYGAGRAELIGHLATNKQIGRNAPGAAPAPKPSRPA